MGLYHLQHGDPLCSCFAAGVLRPPAASGGSPGPGGSPSHERLLLLRDLPHDRRPDHAASARHFPPAHGSLHQPFVSAFCSDEGWHQGVESPRTLWLPQPKPEPPQGQVRSVKAHMDNPAAPTGTSSLFAYSPPSHTL